MKRLYRVLITALLVLSASSIVLAQGMPMGTPRMDDDLLRFAYSMGAYNGIVAVCGEAREKEQAQGYFDEFLQRVEQRVPGYDLQSLQGNFSLGQSSVAMLERVPPAFRAQSCTRAMEQQRADEDFDRLPEKMDQLIDNYLQNSPEKVATDPGSEGDRVIPATPPPPPPPRHNPDLISNVPVVVLNMVKGQVDGYVNASGGYYDVVTFCGFDGDADLVSAANAVKAAFEKGCGLGLGDEFAKGQASMLRHREQAIQAHERACRNGNEHASCGMTSKEYYCHVKEQDLFKPVSRLQIHLDRKQRLMGEIDKRCK